MNNFDLLFDACLKLTDHCVIDYDMNIEPYFDFLYDCNCFDINKYFRKTKEDSNIFLINNHFYKVIDILKIDIDPLFIHKIEPLDICNISFYKETILSLLLIINPETNIKDFNKKFKKLVKQSNSFILKSHKQYYNEKNKLKKIYLRYAYCLLEKRLNINYSIFIQVRNFLLGYVPEIKLNDKFYLHDRYKEEFQVKNLFDYKFSEKHNALSIRKKDKDKTYIIRYFLIDEYFIINKKKRVLIKLENIHEVVLYFYNKKNIIIKHAIRNCFE